MCPDTIPSLCAAPCRQGGRKLLSVRRLWRQALHPVEGFREAREDGLNLAPSFLRMMALRVPVAMVDLLLAYWTIRMLVASLRNLDGPLWGQVRQHLPAELSLEDMRQILKDLPPVPSLGESLPWILLLALLGILGLWLHHAAWDHTCLWILRGIKLRARFRTTLAAEAEALSAGVFGALLGLLSSLPAVGCLFGTLSFLAGVWFWGLRGVALAVYHDCPVWKGVAATVLHVLLMAILAGGLVLLMLAMLAVVLREA